MHQLKNIKVSVIIPAYNVEYYIERSIVSVLNQKFKPFEIVVVDDGSTDDTAKIVEKFKNDVLYIYQKNAGSSSARNLGINKAKGNWIAFLDSDDEWVDSHLLNFSKTLSLNPTIAWYGAPFKVLDEVSKKVIFTPKKGHLREESCHTVFEDYMTTFPPKAYLSSPTMVLRKKVFEDVGYFDTTKKTAVDVDMWFRIGLVYPKIGYSYKEGAVVYRRSLSLSTTKKWKPLESIERFVECEIYAKNMSESAYKRAEPRIMYWVKKLVRASISNGDTKTLKQIKTQYFDRLNHKNKLLVLVAVYFPFLITIVKKLK